MHPHRLPAACAAVLLTLSLGAAAQSDPKPYYDYRTVPRAYEGPGREQPDARGVPETLIGYFGPADPAHFEGGSIWQGTLLAFEDANASLPRDAAPFKLVPVWSANPWAGGVSDLVKVLYREKVWALIGGIDGPTTHLAEQVVAKAQVLLINPAAGDRTIHTAGVPWVFTCVPGDHAEARVLAESLKQRGAPFTVVSAADHDSRAFAAQANAAFRHAGIAPAFTVDFEMGAPDMDAIARRASTFGAGVIVAAAGPRDSARLVKALRANGFAGTIFATSALARGTALAEAGAAAEGVFVPLLTENTPAGASFQKAFVARFGTPPDWAAAHAYDAAFLLLAAFRSAGPNRVRLRDAVQEASPTPGASGTVHWDGLRQNDRPVRLGVIHEKRIAPVNSPGAPPPDAARCQ